MASRWVKAAFLAILGVVILLYADRFVDELRTNIEAKMEVAFPWTWDLLQVLLWVLVAWLFVDAVLTVALSFSEQRYSLADVMRKLDKIEKKLGMAEEKPVSVTPEVEEAREAEAAEEEVPPPPRE